MEDQTRSDLRLGAPVARESIQVCRSFWVRTEASWNGPGTGQVQVHFFRRAGTNVVRRTLSPEDRAKSSPGQRGASALRPSARKLNSFNKPHHFSDQVWQTHPFNIHLAAARHFMNGF